MRYPHMSPEIFHSKWSSYLKNASVLLYNENAFFHCLTSNLFLWRRRLRESLFFRIRRGSRETIVGRKPRKLALNPVTNPSHESSREILFISSSRRQLNNRNSDARHFLCSSAISPVFHPVSQTLSIRLPRGETSILLGDNSEIVPDRSLRRALGRNARESCRRRRHLPSFLPFDVPRYHSRASVRKGSQSYRRV